MTTYMCMFFRLQLYTDTNAACNSWFHIGYVHRVPIMAGWPDTGQHFHAWPEHGAGFHLVWGDSFSTTYTEMVHLSPHSYLLSGSKFMKLHTYAWLAQRINTRSCDIESSILPTQPGAAMSLWFQNDQVGGVY